MLRFLFLFHSAPIVSRYTANYWPGVGTAAFSVVCINEDIFGRRKAKSCPLSAAPVWTWPLDTEEQCLYDVFKTVYRTDSCISLVWMQAGRAVAFPVTHPVINPAEGNGTPLLERGICAGNHWRRWMGGLNKAIHTKVIPPPDKVWWAARSAAD